MTQIFRSQMKRLPSICFWRLAEFLILIGFIISSCHFPTDNHGYTYEYPQLEIVRTDGSGHRVLGSVAGSDVVLADSAVFFEDTDASYSVSEVDYDGSNLTRFHPEIPWAFWDFSYTNHKLLLASIYSDSTGSYNNLYVMNGDGTNLIQLPTPNGSYDSPHESPDLDEIVFCRGGGVAMIRTDGTSLNLIRSKPNGEYCDSPFFLDESNIIYRITDTSNVEEDEQVRLFNTATREDKVIGSFHSGNIEGAFGQNLLYIEYATLLLVNDSTSQITTLSTNIYGAAFSPDGSKIAAITVKKLLLMDSSGADVDTIYSLPNNMKSFLDVYFSPDGKYIVFRTE